jgi:hypothetical protein
MEEEVAKSVAAAIGNAPGNGIEGRHAPAGVSGPPARARSAVPAGVKPGPGQPVAAGKLPPDEPARPAARPQAPAARPPAHRAEETPEPATGPQPAADGTRPAEA